jgi:hypothetical protein
MAFGKNDLRINRNGRPQGSKNRIPDKDKAIDLLNRIIEDLTSSFDELTRDEKIKLLQVFRHLYETNITISENEAPSEIRVNIIKSIDYES